MAELDEEFNNFMHRVNEVNSIVKKLSSTDKELQKIGNLEAERYLHDEGRTVLESIDETNVKLKVKCDRTVINKSALLQDDRKDEATMSQEAFMAEVAKDADKRYKDRLIRKEKMETFKKQATLAFRRGEFERALNCYNKAIEQIRESCMLYNNRCLTFMNLKLYDKAIGDAQTALRLYEDNLKAWLLLAKAHFLNNNFAEFNKAIGEARDRNPQQKCFIEGFVANLKAETQQGETSNSACKTDDVML